MNQYEVTHKANGAQEWVKQVVEAEGAHVSHAGALVIQDVTIIARGWWMCANRVSPGSPAGVIDPQPQDLTGEPQAATRGGGCVDLSAPGHGELGHRCQDGCPVD